MRMNKLIVILVVAVLIGTAVLFWPAKAEEVNDPVDDGPAKTIAWCKFDSTFRASGPPGDIGECKFSFKETKVSKGKYVGDGTDVPTESIFSTLTVLKWGNYDWRIDWQLTGQGVYLEDSVEVNHDLPESASTEIWDGSGIFYLSQAGTYTVTAQLFVLRYGAEELDEPMLATGETSFEVPSEWATE
jgi:nitrogen fixation-related uncharacterized protein